MPKLEIRELPTFHNVAIEIFTTIFIVGVIYRAGTQQFVYRILADQRPTCKTAIDERVQTDVALRLDDALDPGDRLLVRYSPTLFGVLLAAVFASWGVTLTAYSTIATVAVAWLVANWLYMILLDPAVACVEVLRRP